MMIKVQDVASTLYQTLKPQFVYIAVLNDDKSDALVSAALGRTPKGINGVLGSLGNSSGSTWILDELSNEELDSTLAQTLRGLNVELVSRLQTESVIGYLFLGYKQSGNTYSTQDINMLSIAADELAIAIQNGLRFMEIDSFNVTLKQKVEDATNELRQTNEQLKSLDTAKDEFISMASHQLRTPLTSVKGYLSMALEGDAGELSPAQRKLLEEAYASSQRMVYLIGDFLNISRINTGKFTLERSQVDLAKLVEEEVNQLSSTAQSRQLKLHFDKPDNFPLLNLDDNKIRQVVMNFIDNAIFYSKDNGDVKVELARTASGIVFKVKDTGIGVPAAEQSHLFTKFYRASNARKARPDGTGIGLFMAKKVIVAHGGSIILDSTEGKGSVFGFTIPLSAEAQNAVLKNNSDSLGQQPNDQQHNA